MKTKFHNRQLLSILASLLIFHCASHASENNITIYAYEIEHRLQKGGTTQYNSILDRLEENGLKFKLLVLPLARTNASFKKDSKSCLFPSSLESLKKIYPDWEKKELITGKKIDNVSLRIFTRSGEKTIDSIGQLQGKKIAYWNGIDIEKLTKGITYKKDNTSNEEARIKMLNAFRVDAILSFSPDAFIVSEKLKTPAPSYNKDLVIHQDGVTVLCHSTDETKQFIEQFDEKIKALKDNGELKKILGEYSDIF